MKLIARDIAGTKTEWDSGFSADKHEEAIQEVVDAIAAEGQKARVVLALVKDETEDQTPKA